MAYEGDIIRTDRLGAGTADLNAVLRGDNKWKPLSDLNLFTYVVGAVLAYAGSTAPSGYLFCDGSAVSRTTYDDLFSVIGTAFGVGDGSTTFNLPKLDDDRFIMGGTLAQTGGANTINLQHNHTITITDDPVLVAAGIGAVGQEGAYPTSNALSAAQDIRPKFLGLKYIIKY